MPLISARDYLKSKGADPGDSGPSPSSGGLVSAKDFLAQKAASQPKYDGPPDLSTPHTQDEMLQQEYGNFSPLNLDNSPTMKKIQQNEKDNPPIQGPPDLSNRPDLRTDYPGGLLNPVNDINQFRKTKVGQFIDEMAQGAGSAMGLSPDQMSSAASTGNNFADNTAQFLGGTMGYMTNPSQLEMNVGQTFFENPMLQRIAGNLGNRAQNLLPDAGMTLSNEGNIIPSLLGRTVNTGVQGMVQGGLGAAAYAPFQTLINGGQLSDIPKNVLEQGLQGVGFGALAGAAPAIESGIGGLKGLFNKPVEGIPSPGAYETAAQSRNVQDAGPNLYDNGQQFANNFNTKEDLQKQYDQAVQDQYNYLKQSAKAPVLQKGMMTFDPETGNAMDRFGSVSGRPPWYQQFYNENGREPTDKDLMNLAKLHVDQGFPTEFGRAPSFQPQDLQELDNHLQEINAALPFADPDSRASLQQTAAMLEQERQRLIKLMPDSVKPEEAPAAQIGSLERPNVQNMPGNTYAKSFAPPKRQFSGTVTGSGNVIRKALPELQEPRKLSGTVTGGMDIPVIRKAQEAAQPQFDDPNFVNQKTWYHGTGTDGLTAESLYPFGTNHEGLFGQGVYMTDNPSIAQGYAKSRGKRTGTPIVYHANVNVHRVLNLEKPMTPDVAKILKDTFGGLGKEFTQLINKALKQGESFENVFRDIRELISEHSADNGWGRDEYMEHFQDFLTNMKQAGYDAVTHTGGLRTGNAKHRVLIMLDPNDISETGRKGQVTRFEKYNGEPEPQQQQPKLEPLKPPAQRKLSGTVTNAGESVPVSGNVTEAPKEVPKETTAEAPTKPEPTQEPAIKKPDSFIASDYVTPHIKTISELRRNIIAYLNKGLTFKYHNERGKAALIERDMKMHEQWADQMIQEGLADGSIPKRIKDDMVEGAEPPPKEAPKTKRPTAPPKTQPKPFEPGAKKPERSLLELSASNPNIKTLSALRRDLLNTLNKGLSFLYDGPNKEELIQTARMKNEQKVDAMIKEAVQNGTIPKRIKMDLPGFNPDVQAYSGNNIPFRQAAAQAKDTISRTDVINNMRKNLGVTIDTGRLVSGKGALGEYKVTPEVIRSRMSQDIQTISHEIGHHLDKKFNLQDPRFQPELDSLMQATGHNVSAYQPHQLPAEGIAEYVRLRLTDPQEAARLAPNFERYFNSKLDKQTLAGLAKTQKDVDTWISQGEYNQAVGLTDFTGGEKSKPFTYDKWYTQFVDDLNPLKLLEKALKGKIGLGSDSIYKMARLSRGVTARAELAVSKGIFDANGHKIADGLAEIVRPLEEIGMKQKDFSTYLAVKHAQDLKAMGKRVPFDDRQMQAVLNRWDNNPVVQTAQKKIIQFNNALTDILVDAQVLSQKAVADMRQKYPNYVPFMRYFDDDAVAGFKNGGFGAAKGFANITNPIKKMSDEGSLRTIVNPLESMVKNAFLVMNAAAKNKVGLQLADLSKIDGAGAWVEHVGEGGASPHEHIVSVYQNGERNSYKVRNPDLYNAMLSLDNESTNSLMRFLGGAASSLRAGATLTPDFMLRNMLRDVFGNTVNATKYGFNPMTIFNGLFHILSPKLGGSSKIFDQFLSSGGAMGTMMSLDRDMNREALSKVFRESLKDKTMNVVTSPKELAKFLSGYTAVKKTVGVLRKGSELSELATRVGAFNKALKKTGSLEEAAYSARDLMDFNRAGTSIRQANRAIAFLNASIQGVDRMARAFKENPASFLVRAFTSLVLPSIGVYYWNHNLPPDDKAVYDNIPQWQKDSFFVIGIPGTKQFIRIPKPFEAGMLFATGTDRILRWAEDHDPQAFQDYGQSVLSALTPPMLMTSLTPLLEAITNHSFFRNAPIVPQGEQGLDKKDQYGLFTSETAKLLGNIMSKTPFANTNFASPRIIDNTIKGYTAGLGNYAVQGLDSLIKAAKGGQETPLPAKQTTEQPFLQSFFVNTSGGGQVRQDFYDKWNQLSQDKASADKKQQPFTNPDYYRMKAADAAITNIMKVYKLIQSDKVMDPQTKRAKLDLLDSQMNQIAAKGLGR